MWPVKQIDSAITWILSILQKQKQHVSVMGSNTWLNMDLMPFHIYAYNGVWFWYMSLPVKRQEQSYRICLCIRASQIITFALILQKLCLYLIPLRILSDFWQFDRLLFLCIICHWTFLVLWCLSHQVLDQKCFAAPKELNKFSLVTMLTLDGFGRQSETISVTPWKLSGIQERTWSWTLLSNMFATCWFFVVSTLKQVLKE